MGVFYKAEKVTEHVTAIRSLTGEILYLVQGNEKAVLIDTCVGAGNLRAFADTLTGLPLTVLLTHGHIDHAMGAPEFPLVYMNHADTDVYMGMRDVEGRKGYVMANLGGQMPESLEETFLPPAPMTFRDLQDGDTFDLGGFHITAVSLPGHTPGSMVFLLQEERILILGDACNKATFLFDENALPVETYKKNLQSVQKRLAGRYDRVFISHHDMEMPVDLMQQVIDVCDVIMEGKADDVPFDFMGQKSYIAKAADERMNRLDGLAGNIIYSKGKIWA